MRFQDLFHILLILSVLFVDHETLAATASAVASVTIVPALKVTKLQDLNFGPVGQGSEASTLSVSKGSKNPGVARFEVQGEKGRSIQIILPQEPILLQGAGNQSLTVKNFVSYPSQTGVVSDAGNLEILVGATLDSIRADQPTGEYQGSFEITLTY